jgi:hypothetical protein
MDQPWMYDLARIDPVLIENVRHFVEEAMRHANREKKSDIFCPCVDCNNKIVWSDSKVVKSHLIKRGFKKSYTIWTTHGEIDNALLEVDRGELEMTILIIRMEVYLMGLIMALMMMMITKSYCVTSNQKC